MDSLEKSIANENIGHRTVPSERDLNQGHLRETPVVDYGLRKAAVLLASLPSEDTAYLLRQLDESQLTAIARAAKELPFRREEQAAVLSELMRIRQASQNSRSQPTVGLAPDDRRAKQHSADARASNCNRHAFEPITAASAATLVRLLMDELPQTMAVVLANIDPCLAAQVLERLPTDKQTATTMRIADLRTPDPTAVTQVAAVLVERFRELDAPPSSPIGGAAHVAQILRHTNSATEKALLANVGQEDCDLVRSVSRHLSVLRHLSPTDGRCPTSDGEISDGGISDGGISDGDIHSAAASRSA